MIFFVLDLSEGMENCKMSGKNQGILKWMISGNPDNYDSTCNNNNKIINNYNV